MDDGGSEKAATAPTSRRRTCWCKLIPMLARSVRKEPIRYHRYLSTVKE